MKQHEKEKGIILKLPFKAPNERRTVFKIEHLLRTLGVSFDTGTDFTTRDWYLDWSLKGAEIK
jgi:hypothetical protein